MIHRATLIRPSGTKGKLFPSCGSEEKAVCGSTLRDIENQANQWGALRVALKNGDVWRKLEGEWIIL